MCLKNKEKTSPDSPVQNMDSQQGTEETAYMVQLSDLPHDLTKKQILDKFPIGTKIHMQAHAHMAYLEFESREEAKRAILDHDLRKLAKMELVAPSNPNSTANSHASFNEQMKRKSVERHMIKVEQLSPEMGEEILRKMFPDAIKIHIDRERGEAHMEFESAEMKESALHRQYVNVVNPGSQSSIAQHQGHGQGHGRGQKRSDVQPMKVRNKDDSSDLNNRKMLEAWDKPFSLVDMIMEPGFVGLYNLPPGVTTNDLMNVFPNSSAVDIVAREKEGASAILEFMDASRADEVYHQAQQLKIGGRPIKAKILPSGSAGKKIMLHINSKEATKRTNHEFNSSI